MKKKLRDQAALFDQCAGKYARFRPAYADEAIDWAVQRASLETNACVCDLGAGTGILSESLAKRNLRVIAVEPLEKMRAMGRAGLRALQLTVDFRAGWAEEIPLSPGSVRAVFCGQAFHWFDHDHALPEMHRVIECGGALVVLWNNRKVRAARWLRELESLFTLYNPRHRQGYRSRNWKELIERGGRFEIQGHRKFLFELRLSVAEVLGLIASFSYVQVIDAPSREALQEDVRALLRSNFGPSRGRSIPLPMETEVYVARRLP